MLLSFLCASTFSNNALLFLSPAGSVFSRRQNNLCFKTRWESSRSAEEKIKTRPLLFSSSISAQVSLSALWMLTHNSIKKLLHRSHYTQMALFIHSCTHLHWFEEKLTFGLTSGRKADFPANILFALRSAQMLHPCVIKLIFYNANFSNLNKVISCSVLFCARSFYSVRIFSHLGFLLRHTHEPTL